MLSLPKTGTIYRYCAIDPGSDTLGYAVFEVSLIDATVRVVEVRTVSASRMSRGQVDVRKVHGDHFAKMLAHRHAFKALLDDIEPHSVIAETPYMGSFAKAFGSLTEGYANLRNAVFEYDPAMPLEGVDPTTAKLAVGVSGRGKTKEDVKKGLLEVLEKDKCFTVDADVQLLDEHSVDAIVVGYHKYLELLNDFPA
ncbi:MAG: hypothetical protein CL678_15430 [Bdellovibrionaceae bacterium]|nr:hypothetical protein [Pseudobdellovibrionaceae bacterium]